MKLHKIAFVLLVIGGLNWLLVGIMPSWDLATYVGMTAARVIYLLVGISAIYEAVGHKKNCRNCTAPAGQM